MIPRLGPLEVGLIVAIILMVFGVGKLPQVGGAIGKGWHAFRKGQSGQEDEEEPARARKKATRKVKMAASSTKQSES